MIGKTTKIIFLFSLFFVVPAWAVVPVLDTIADDSSAVNVTYTKQPTLSAGTGVGWVKTYGPDDLTVNASTGAVSWAIPTGLARESFYIGVKATNADGSDEEIWILKVGGGDFIYCGTGETATHDTISECTALAASGDTIVVRNGTYTGAANAISNAGDGTQQGTLPPSGSSGVFTSVMAEAPGATILDGQDVRAMISMYGNYISRAGWEGATGTYDGSCVAFKGFTVKNAGGEYVVGAVQLNHTNHIKLTELFVCDGINDAAPLSVFRSGYVLVENCVTWGRGRMQIIFYICDYVIMRRCVARQESTSATNPVGVFDFYACQHSRGQDLIAVDGMQNSPNITYQSGIIVNNRGGYVDNDPGEGDLLDNSFRNIIILNNEGSLLSNQETAGDQTEIHNSIVWGVTLLPHGACCDDADCEQCAESLIFGNDQWAINQMTIGDVSASGNNVWRSLFNGMNRVGTVQTITNSIVYHTRNADTSSLGIFYDIAYPIYNNIYDTGAITTYGDDNTAGTSITTNPLTNGLLYLPRIESGGSLKTAGQSGVRVGAEILYFRGKSGTLFGETGYDSDTAAPCWPWPQEIIIGSMMAAYPSSGARGFATGTSLNGTPQTLTKYIWEYLGNQIPADIYGEDSVTVATHSGSINAGMVMQ